MKKLLLTSLVLFASCLGASAQCNGIFQPNTLCGNLSASPAPPSQFSAGGTVIGPGTTTPGDLAVWNNNSGTLLKDEPFSFYSANPTATAGPTAVNGSASTFMRSDAAPAIQLGSASQKGILQGDNATTTISSGIIAVNQAYAFVWTAVHKFFADVYFGSGNPWVDVKSGANSCAAAVGNGTNNDYTAANCQSAYLVATFGGGTLNFPIGTFNFNGNTLTTGIGVTFKGAGRCCTTIENLTDATVISFPASVSGGGYGGLRDINVVGYQNSAAGNYVVTIGANAAIFIYDTSIIGGSFALYDAGVDGTISDSFISGYSGGIYSVGANWFRRCKLDGPWGSGVATTYAFYQATPNGATAENHFEQCDFSGSWTDSVDLATCSSCSQFTVFVGSIFAATVSLASGITMFLGNEIGSSLAIGAGAVGVVTGNAATGSALTISNSGTLKCAGNFNITNSGC